MNLTYFVVALKGSKRFYVKVEAENVFQAFAKANKTLIDRGIDAVSCYTLPSFKGGYPIQVRREKWIEEE